MSNGMVIENKAIIFYILIINGMKISSSKNYSIFTPIKGYFLGIISSTDVLVFLCS